MDLSMLDTGIRAALDFAVACGPVFVLGLVTVILARGMRP
jgi:hypothetical protein